MYFYVSIFLHILNIETYSAICILHFSLVIDDVTTEQEIPIMVTHFVLQIPNILIIPTIEELQHHFGKVITGIIEACRSVTMWGHRYSTNTQESLGNDTL